MNWNYENYLSEKLERVKLAHSEFSHITIKVASEQIFAKIKQFDEDTIYVLIRYLSSSITYDAEQVPIQILALSEQNNLNACKTILDEFATTYNWKVEISGTTYIKQQYSSPVVVSNFNEVTYGYRSVIYASGTLFVLENLLPISNLTIDGVVINPLNFNFNYTMTPNTQPVGSDKIASSVKSIASFQISFTIPFKSLPKTSPATGDLMSDIMDIATGVNTGNKDFAISFKYGNTTVFQTPVNMKLINVNVSDAPNEIPGIQLSFIK